MSRPLNTIRTYALVAAAVTSVALIGISCWLIYLVSRPNWCSQAIGASQYVDGRPEFAVSGCFSLLRQQVATLSINSYIALGTLALCLAVLVVIVIAGGRLSFKASRDGVEGNIGRERAAQEVANAAQDEADEIRSEQ